MISNRLKTISSLTKGFDKLLDVGSDHGLLPIYAINSNYVKKAIASDINSKPLEMAKKNIIDYKVDIDLVLYDGIPKCDADVVVIAGMGSELIIQILEKTLNNAINLKRLVLSPNCDYDILRRFMQDKFHIVDEVVIYDKNHYYEAIAYEEGCEKLSDYEIYFGPINLKNKTDLFIKKYEKRLNQLLNIVDGITDKVKKEEITKEINFIKDMMNNA